MSEDRATYDGTPVGNAISMMERHAALTGEKNNTVIPNHYLEWVEWDYTAAAVFRAFLGWFTWIEGQGGEEFQHTEDDWKRRMHLSLKQVNRAITVINTMTQKWIGDETTDGPTLITKRIGYATANDGSRLSSHATYYRINHDLYNVVFDKILVARRPRSAQMDDPIREAQTGVPEDYHLGASYLDNNGNKNNSKMGDSDESPVVPVSHEGANVTEAGGTVKEPAYRESGKSGTLAHVSGGKKNPTPTPPREQTPAEKAAAATAREMVSAFCETAGIPQVTAKAKAMGQAKVLLAAGSSVAEVRAITEWLVANPWWRDQGITFDTVVSQRDKYLTARALDQQAKASGKNPARRYMTPEEAERYGVIQPRPPLFPNGQQAITERGD